MGLGIAVSPTKSPYCPPYRPGTSEPYITPPHWSPHTPPHAIKLTVKVGGHTSSPRAPRALAVARKARSFYFPPANRGARYLSGNPPTSIRDIHQARSTNRELPRGNHRARACQLRPPKDRCGWPVFRFPPAARPAKTREPLVRLRGKPKSATISYWNRPRRPTGIEPV